MHKQVLLDLIESFTKETWKYKENDGLYIAMNYIYEIEFAIKTTDNLDLEETYNKLLAIIGIIKFKYGFESEILSKDSNLKELYERVNKIDIGSNNIILEYLTIKNEYDRYVEKITNLDFLHLERTGSNEGLYLAVESLKSLITNREYRGLLQKEQISEILIDCVRLINKTGRIEKIAEKYKNIIKEIWGKTLSNGINGKEFRILFSNISGGYLIQQSGALINRKKQRSCSMISSNFIATYGSKLRKIGFIYPNSSDIILASAYDLGSNVFGEGAKNEELGSSLVTPEILEKIGISRVQEKGEDIYSSNCYSEILVDSMPCGIVIIGYGENDLNIDYQYAVMISKKLNIPLYTIDLMNYKSELNEDDKDYIAFHCILSYLGISMDEFNKLVANNEEKKLSNLIDNHKEVVVQKYLELKEAGLLNKENIFKLLSTIIKRESINQTIQDLYNKYGYGLTRENDHQLLTELQNYNMTLDSFLLATGQSGYFSDQISANGLGSQKLDPQDLDDVKYIAMCFGKEIKYSDNNIPITYTTLLGTTEFNYGVQTFPAGIFENVFQCNPNHSFPIQPIVGESEQDFYLRLLEHQIESSPIFNADNKEEVLRRGKRLINNFCSKKGRIYFVKLSDVKDTKASFGDEYGLRDGKLSLSEAQEKISSLLPLSELLMLFGVDMNNPYSNPNMDSEYGIALYDKIPQEKLQYIEVESRYQMMQKRARQLGYKDGDTIPPTIGEEVPTFIQK